MWHQYHPDLPWIVWAHSPDQDGYLVHDRRTSQTRFCLTPDGIHQFAADHSSNGRGLGDLVHRATSTLGIKRCGECAKRQIAMNLRTPWR